MRLVGAPAVGPGLVTGGVSAVRRPAGLVTAAAGRLQEARGREAEGHAAGDDRPGCLRPKSSRSRRIVSPSGAGGSRRGSRALGGLLGELRRLVLALLAELVRDALRMSDAVELTCSPACVERVSTCSRTRFAAWPFASCAFSVAFSLA